MRFAENGDRSVHVLDKQNPTKCQVRVPGFRNEARQRHFGTSIGGRPQNLIVARCRQCSPQSECMDTSKFSGMLETYDFSLFEYDPNWNCEPRLEASSSKKGIIGTASGRWDQFGS
jgi:hypothetical protein